MISSENISKSRQSFCKVTWLALKLLFNNNRLNYRIIIIEPLANLSKLKFEVQPIFLILNIIYETFYYRTPFVKIVITKISTLEPL